MTQAESDKLSAKMLEQLDTDKIPGFRLPPLGEKMRTNGSCLNPYVSITKIAKEKKTPVQAISFKAGCGVIRQLSIYECGRESTILDSKRIPVMTYPYSTLNQHRADAFAVDRYHSRHRNENKSRQGRWNDCTP